ncbi:MAG: hypothetical protein DRJ66_05750 [Thermoprotei archaeon]|nr:MAG: hypothetical protein DRJ66_05750 [Thermoprotei archaeon]
MWIRERVLAALTRDEVDYIPWVVKSNHLPRGYLERVLRNKGLGISHHERVFRTYTPDVICEYKYVGNFLVRTFITPIGNVSERIRINLPSEGGERSTQWKVESLIKSPGDYKVLEFIIENTKIKSEYEDFKLADESIGQDGIVYTSLGYTPLMELIVNYMGFRTFALEIKRRQNKVESLMELIHEKKLEACRIVAKSPAKVVLLGDNIDEVIVDPRLFKKYCIPYYREYIEILHEHDKIVGSHMDGRLKRLKNLIAETGLDFIHGFTPPPYGNLTLREARQCWKDMAIWMNIPETVFFYDSERIMKFIRDILKEGAPGDGLILGITETVPPRRRLVGYKAITEAILRYGKYPIRIP